MLLDRAFNVNTSDLKPAIAEEATLRSVEQFLLRKLACWIRGSSGNGTNSSPMTACIGCRKSITR